MSRGAPRAPITYEGEYDPTRTYLPRQVAHVTAGATRTGYLSTATTTGDDPATSPTIWLPLGGGGDGEHNGTGTNSTAVGTDATASADSTTSLGDSAAASGTGVGGSTSIGAFSGASGQYATSLGAAAQADPDSSIAIGGQAHVGVSADQGVAVGYQAIAADAANNVAVGPQATADTAAEGVAIGHAAHSAHTGAVAIGQNAVTTADYCAAIHCDQVEAAPATGGASFFVVSDSAGGRWKIGTSTGGALTIAAA